MDKILFVCLHGAAKSLIASEYFNRLASAKGLAVRSASAGVEPDDEVPPPVVLGLLADGIDLGDYRPRQLTPDELDAATYVVSFGCELPARSHSTANVEMWDDLPMVSDGYERARSLIVERVEDLVRRLPV